MARSTSLQTHIAASGKPALSLPLYALIGAPSFMTNWCQSSAGYLRHSAGRRAESLARYGDGDTVAVSIGATGGAVASGGVVGTGVMVGAGVIVAVAIGDAVGVGEVTTLGVSVREQLVRTSAAPTIANAESRRTNLDIRDK